MRLPVRTAVCLLLLTACVDGGTLPSGSAEPTTETIGGSMRTSSTASETTVRSVTSLRVPAPSVVTSTSIPAAVTTAGPEETFHVLVFHKTAGFRHESIEAGIDALVGLGAEEGFTISATEESSIFTDGDLAGFQVIVFLNTTGDVLDDAQQGAMERFITEDGGFVGIHSAADTEYEWDWYGRLVGAYFDNHPAPQRATVHVTAPNHPVTREMPPEFESFDEWYNFDAVPEGAEILATLDESSYEGGTMGEPHPLVWAQELNGGRSLYTGFGHTAEAFSEALILDHLGAGIRWAAGRDGGR